MMNAKRSSRLNLARYMFLLPAVVVLLLVFSFSNKAIAKKAINRINYVFNSVVRLPEGKVTGPAIAKPEVAASTGAADTIISKKSNTKGKTKSFVIVSDKHEALNYVLNGQRSTKAEVDALDPAKIKRMNVLSAGHAKKVIPELAEGHGVIVIATEGSKEGQKLEEKIQKALGEGKVSTATGIGTSSASTVNGMSYTIATADGKVDTTVKYVVTARVNNNVSNDVNVNSSVNVVGVNHDSLKTVSYVIADGKATTIKYDKSSQNQSVELNSSSKPLYVINGKEATAKEFKNLKVENIESISVLKDETAVRKYGDKGKNGVILITTK